MALPVQLPFHRYEEEVYQIVESRIPTLPTSFVEADSRQSMSLTSLGSPPAGPTGTNIVLPPFSPQPLRK